MFTRSRYSLLTILTALFTFMPISAHADLRAEIRQATKDFRDITLSAKVLQANQKELKKIGKDFPKSYDFKKSTIMYKSPDKMRMEAKLGMVRVAIVINHNTKSIQAPGLHLSKKEDISKDPHKRQGDLDIGIVTDQLWHDYIVKDAELEKGASGAVYRVVFVRSNSKQRKNILWMEMKTFRLLKVEKYGDEGELLSRYIYSGHKQVGPVWVPSRIDVYNREGKLAGATGYENVKVNTGIPDSVFKP